MTLTDFTRRGLLVLILAALTPNARAEEDYLDDTTQMRIIEDRPGAIVMRFDHRPPEEIQGLIKTLQNLKASSEEKRDACYELMERPADSRVAKAALREAARDPDLRVIASVTLFIIETANGPAFEAPPALRIYFPRPQGRLTRDARAALDVVMDALHSSNIDDRIKAGGAFRNLPGYTSDIADILLEALKTAQARNDPATTIDALIDALRELGPASAAAGPQVVAAMDQHPKLRGDCLYTLGKIGPAFTGGRAAVLRMLTCDDPQVRNSAATALVRLSGPQATAAIPELMTVAAEDVHNMSTQMAVESLGEIGSGAAAAVPILLKTLSRADSADFRVDIHIALGKIGPAAEAALPQLRASARNENDGAWVEAAEAICRITADHEREVAQGRIKAALHHEWTFYRHQAARALLRLHVHYPESTQTLLSMLTTKSNQDRFMSAAALHRLNAADADAIGALRQELEGDPDRDGPSPSMRRRAAAADALGQIGPAAASALPALEKMAHSDSNIWAQQIAAIAIRRIKSPASSKSLQEK